MRIGYFGSPPISATLLDALLEAPDHEVAFVVSNPDRPRGRSGRPVPTACSALALERGLPLFRYESLKQAGGQGPGLDLAGYACDLYVVFAYGRLLPRSVFAQPEYGTVNLHASLLPELRGASPIQSAILRGYTTTGWTLQQMEAELDSGAIIAAVPLAVEPNETAGELTERMLPTGVQLVLDSLHDFRTLSGKSQRQEHERATFCSKFSTQEADLDWAASALELHNKVRALNPWPVARTVLSGRTVRILTTRVGAHHENQLPGARPAELLPLRVDGLRRLFVGTGTGLLEILSLQMENRRPMDAQAFLNGVQIASGTCFSRQKSLSGPDAPAAAPSTGEQ